MKNSSINRQNSLVKKAEAFSLKIQQCEKLILSHEIAQAKTILEQIILGKEFLDFIEFEGVGNTENWDFYYPKGPIEWFAKAIENEEIQGNPFDLLNVCFMIELHERATAVQQAIEFYDQLKRKLGDRVQILLGLGNIYYHNQEFVQALKMYNSANEKQSNSQRTWECLAWVNYRLDKTQSAQKAIQKCLQLNQNSRTCEFLAILTQSDSKNTMKKLQKLAEKYPNYYRIYIALGFDSKDTNEVMNYHKKALTFDPDSSYLKANIAQAFFQAIQLEKDSQGANLKQAYKWADAALACLLVSWKAFYIMGKIAFFKNHVEQAITILKTGIQQYPNNILLHDQLAEYYEGEKKYLKAIECYIKCTELKPQRAQFFCNIGDLYNNLNQWTEAVKYYQKAIEINSALCFAFANLAKCYRNQNRIVAAATYYAKANVICPKKSRYLNGLSACYFELGDYCLAKKAALKSLELAKTIQDKRDSLHNLEDSQFALGNYDEAMQWHWREAKEEQNFDPAIIMRKLIQPLNQQKTRHILDKIVNSALESLPKIRENVYPLLKLAQIFRKFYLGQADKSGYLYEIVAKLHEDQFVSDQVEQLLKEAGKGIWIGNWQY